MFILDDGLKIFVWCGAKSRLNDRSKGRLVADRINKLERKNKAQLMLFRAVSQRKKEGEIYNQHCSIVKIFTSSFVFLYWRFMAFLLNG